MPTKEIVSDGESKMKKSVEVLHDELKVIRSGRASTALVENIKADFYGTPTPLKQMAALATPQVDMIVSLPRVWLRQNIKSSVKLESKL